MVITAESSLMTNYPMYTFSSHPTLASAIAIALFEANIRIIGQNFSGHPLTKTQLDRIEAYLSTIPDLDKEVSNWCTGMPNVLLSFGEAMEYPNGALPAADFVLLMYAAHIGDM